MWKWIIAMLALAAAIYYIVDSDRLDSWNQEMREGSEERSGVDVETAPVPGREDD